MRYTIMYSYYFITDDFFINSVVTHGFLFYPHQFSGVFRVHKLPQVGVGSGAVRGKVSFLLLSRAIVKVDDSLDLCLSPILVVTNRSGGLRVILESR